SASWCPGEGARHCSPPLQPVHTLAQAGEARRTQGSHSEGQNMRRLAAVCFALSAVSLFAAPDALSASARVAALQIGLRAHGLDPGPVDGIRGPLTRSATIAF